LTGLVVPLLVNVLTDARPGGNVSRGSLTSFPQGCPRPSPEAEERVLAQGWGPTAEEAWRDAVRSALRTAVTALVDAHTWARDGRFICASVLGDGQGLVTRCQDLGCTWDRGAVGREVAVFVARAALVDKLRAARVPVLGDVAR
jgi:hypothetical protein